MVPSSAFESSRVMPISIHEDRGLMKKAGCPWIKREKHAFPVAVFREDIFGDKEQSMTTLHPMGHAWPVGNMKHNEHVMVQCVMWKVTCGNIPRDIAQYLQCGLWVSGMGPGTTCDGWFIYEM